MKQEKLYVDSNDIKRGYYVYVHRNKQTSEVFYVGKGCLSRAWDTDNRNGHWEEYVRALTDGWYVEIIKEDLSEIEAFDLEEACVEKYGGHKSNGGKLTNWTAGGESPCSFKFELSFNDFGYSKAYWDARNFKSLNRIELEATVGPLLQSFIEINDELSKLDDGNENAEDVQEDSDYDPQAELSVYGIISLARDLIGRRISWKDFAMNLESELEIIESDFNDLEIASENRKLLFVKSIRLLKEVMEKIDSGNKAEAQKAALETAEKKQLESKDR